MEVHARQCRHRRMRERLEHSQVNKFSVDFPQPQLRLFGEAVHRSVTSSRIKVPIDVPSMGHHVATSNVMDASFVIMHFVTVSYARLAENGFG